jgi:hypothetical protein
LEYITPNLWNSLYHPLNFSKPVKLPLKSVSKNHSKSQKNHKMKNSIVLDSKWVDLHCEHIIWYALIHFFTAMKKSIDLKLQQKNILKHTILCSLCRSTHLESNTIGFFILWFFCDLLWFFKTALEGNLTGFGKFRGWYRPFHRLGGYVVHPP